MSALTYHQVQARVGASSAHPGAFQATIDLLSHLKPDPGCRILECGCGTGRTACHLALKGHSVTAVDWNPEMLAKARRRAEAEGVQVEWVEADVRNLPFAEGKFDLLLAESVTVFTPADQVLPEYYRVLAPGGRAADLEMAAMPGLSAEARAGMRDFFRYVQLPTYEEWRSLYRAAGFASVDLWRPRHMDLRLNHRSHRRYPDPHQFVDEGAIEDPDVQAVLYENGFLMAANHRNLGFGAIIAQKL